MTVLVGTTATTSEEITNLQGPIRVASTLTKEFEEELLDALHHYYPDMKLHISIAVSLSTQHDHQS